MISKEEFEEILAHRVKLKEKIEDLKKKQKCKHEVGEIAFTGSWTEVSCKHCGMGYPMTHSGDGSCMSQQHMIEYNIKKKTKKEQKWFAKYLNDRLQEKIDDANKALKNMFLLNFYKRLFKKPRLEILQFDRGGTCVDMYGTSMSIISPSTFWGNKNIFIDNQLSVRNGCLSSNPDSEWE